MIKQNCLSTSAGLGTELDSGERLTRQTLLSRRKGKGEKRRRENRPTPSLGQTETGSPVFLVSEPVSVEAWAEMEGVGMSSTWNQCLIYSESHPAVELAPFPPPRLA